MAEDRGRDRITGPTPADDAAGVRVERLRIRMPAGHDPTALARAVAEHLAAALPGSAPTGDLGDVHTRVQVAGGGHVPAEQLAEAVLAAVAARRSAFRGGEG